jgi:hypothetical protein
MLLMLRDTKLVCSLLGQFRNSVPSDFGFIEDLRMMEALLLCSFLVRQA